MSRLHVKTVAAFMQIVWHNGVLIFLFLFLVLACMWIYISNCVLSAEILIMRVLNCRFASYCTVDALPAELLGTMEHRV